MKIGDIPTAIVNARLFTAGATSDDTLIKIRFEEGSIAAIEPQTAIRGGRRRATQGEIDANGGLVAPTFINGHLHLDKVHTLAMIGDAALNDYHAANMGGAMSAIEAARAVKQRYDRRWILPNVRSVCDQAIRYGTSHIRAFADVDTAAGLEGVAALLEARQEYADRLTLQVVAFPQDGLARDPGAFELVEEALRMGADVVGGIPWIEYTDETMRSHVDDLFALALRYDKPISMLVDDAGAADLRTTECLAVAAIRANYQRRVTAQHARAMALYSEPYYRKLVALLQQAEMGVVSDPHTGPLHARVRDLYHAGVAVALGQDDIEDAYYPFGRNNMLEVGFLAAHLLWMTSESDLAAIFDMLTTRAACALGLPNHIVEQGAAATLVVLAAPTITEALRDHEAPRWVIRDGVVVTTNPA